MFPPNAYRIRFADSEDTGTLGWLAERGGQQPLAGRVLIGQLDGMPAAALSLSDGRVVADPARGTDRLVAALRMRAGAIRAYEATPSLSERLAAAFSAYLGEPTVVPAPVSRDDQADEEDARLAA